MEEIAGVIRAYGVTYKQRQAAGKCLGICRRNNMARPASIATNSIQARSVLRVSRRQRRQWRSGPARVIAFDEMWTYVGGRRLGQRRSRWV